METHTRRYKTEVNRNDTTGKKYMKLKIQSQHFRGQGRDWAAWATVWDPVSKQNLKTNKTSHVTCSVTE